MMFEPVCWHNNRPMGARTSRILRDQLVVIEEGRRVLIHEAMEYGVGVVCFAPDVLEEVPVREPGGRR